jgi:hypothetical protein
LVFRSAATPGQYLAAFTDERRTAMTAIADVTRRNLADGYREAMQYGMTGWYVPLEGFLAHHVQARGSSRVTRRTTDR